ncbi:MAG: hypothetical protein V1712_01425 [Patescibacteria group bacterium]
MKRFFYLVAFTFLGLLCQFVVHALVEIWYIDLLVKNFSRYGFGWSWNTWYIIHDVITWVLVLVGLLFGYWQGRHWWVRLYDEQGKLKHLRRNYDDGVKSEKK